MPWYTLKKLVEEMYTSVLPENFDSSSYEFLYKLKQNKAAFWVQSTCTRKIAQEIITCFGMKCNWKNISYSINPSFVHWNGKNCATKSIFHS